MRAGLRSAYNCPGKSSGREPEYRRGCGVVVIAVAFAIPALISTFVPAATVVSEVTAVSVTPVSLAIPLDIASPIIVAVAPLG
jgi:hypothetical protein